MKAKSINCFPVSKIKVLRIISVILLETKIIDFEMISLLFHARAHYSEAFKRRGLCMSVTMKEVWLVRFACQLTVVLKEA